MAFDSAISRNPTLEEYAKSDNCEENWMVWLLSDERDGGGLRQEHPEMAQHVILLVYASD